MPSRPRMTLKRFAQLQAKEALKARMDEAKAKADEILAKRAYAKAKKVHSKAKSARAKAQARAEAIEKVVAAENREMTLEAKAVTKKWGRHAFVYMQDSNQAANNFDFISVADGMTYTFSDDQAVLGCEYVLSVPSKPRGKWATFCLTAVHCTITRATFIGFMDGKDVKLLKKL